ncbi:hypothetical protein R1sor_023091 [Riccia sorocarpa]|uniref:DUF4283 domain-containing protein n=1 Tax=Riccia sorocarpa TaxID=122646 RepID=A0ABD3GPX0_9MARC
MFSRQSVEKMMFPLPWDIRFTTKDLKSRAVPVWLELNNVHPGLMNFGLNMLRMIGPIIYAAKNVETQRVNNHQGRGHFARVCPLNQKRSIALNGEGATRQAMGTQHGLGGQVQEGEDPTWEIRTKKASPSMAQNKDPQDHGSGSSSSQHRGQKGGLSWSNENIILRELVAIPKEKEHADQTEDQPDQLVGSKHMQDDRGKRLSSVGIIAPQATSGCKKQ